MADVKVSGLPSDSALDGNHYVPVNDPVGPTTKRTLLSTLAAFFFNQVNIPDGSASPRTRFTEMFYDFVASGCVWSGDSYGSTRVASMTAGVVYINGRRIVISAVVSRTFTASKDTYIYVLDNGDGTGTLVYTEVSNNAASPAMAANSILIGIIVTGAGNIANVGSVNQGQLDKVLPIASSVPYQVTDSLGNMNCSRDPNRKLLGYRQRSTTFSMSGTSRVQIPELSVPVKPPTGRKVEAQFYTPSVYDTSGAGGFPTTEIWDGAVGTTLVQLAYNNLGGSAGQSTPTPIAQPYTPAGNTTFNVSMKGSAAHNYNADTMMYLAIYMC